MIYIRNKTIFHLCIQESGLFQQFETRRRSGVLLGDSGYACKRWLLTPFRDNQLRGCRKRENYNREQKRARCLVERSFGQLKRRWACLHGELLVTPGKACKVIVACCALHNVAKSLTCRISQMTTYKEERCPAFTTCVQQQKRNCISTTYC